MSEWLCKLASLGGSLSYSWQSYKLLKTREEISIQLSKLELENEDIENEEEISLNLKLHQHLTKNEMKEILKFWTVFAMLMVFEIYIEVFVFWIPFYYTLKFVVVLWLVLPHSKGGAVIFDQIVAPQMRKIQNWADTVAKPKISIITKNTLDGALTTYIHLCKSVSSTDQLDEVQIKLENLIDSIQEEKERREKGLNSKSFDETNENQNNNDYIDDDVVSKEEKESKRNYSSYIIGWFSSSSSSTSTTRSTTTTNQEEKYEEEKMYTKDESASWVMNAFDGVVGLTMSTKEVLLGGNPKNDNVPIVQEEKQEEKQDQSKYAAGFDQLSECEDSSSVDDQPSLQSAGSFVQLDEANIPNDDDDDDDDDDNENSIEIEEETIKPMPRKKRQNEPLRRRAPVTRSRSKYQIEKDY